MGVGHKYFGNSRCLAGKREENRFVGRRQLLRELGFDAPLAYEYEFLKNDHVRVYQKDVKGHFGCVNALEISPDEKLLVSGGDDRRVILWTICDLQINKAPKPIAIMEQMHNSNIFSLAFSNHCERIYSAGNDTFLFVHDIATRQVVQRMKAKSAFYNISTNPIDDNLIITASDDGKIRMHDLRQKDNIIVVRKSSKYSGGMYCAQFNPRKPNIVSVCSKQDGLVIYDSRRWDRPWISLCSSENGQGEDGSNGCSVMYGQWNGTGDGLFAARSRSSSIYYDFCTGGSVEFSAEGFVNSCTVKSCSFISPELVMTGSDDWNIYVWKIPNLDRESKFFTLLLYFEFLMSYRINSAYRVLKGHRSIVNHVRYSRLNRTLFSSGVEKIIKLWSEFNLNESYYDPIRRQYIHLENDFIDPSYDDSVDEDLYMLGFFDSLTTRGGFNMDSEVGILDVLDDDDSDDDSFMGRYQVSDLGSVHRSGTSYVMSSPEMSEPELLDEDGEHPAYLSSGNISAYFGHNASQHSEDTGPSSSGIQISSEISGQKDVSVNRSSSFSETFDHSSTDANELSAGGWK